MYAISFVTMANTNTTTRPASGKAKPIAQPDPQPPASRYALELLPTYDQLERWIDDLGTTLAEVLGEVGRSKTRAQFKRLREHEAPEVLHDCYRWLLAEERRRRAAGEHPTTIGDRFVFLEDWAELGLRYARIRIAPVQANVIALLDDQLARLRHEIGRAEPLADLEERTAAMRAGFERGAF